MRQLDGDLDEQLRACKPRPGYAHGHSCEQAYAGRRHSMGIRTAVSVWRYAVSAEARS